MKRAWTRGEKWLWAAPLLFGIAAGAMTFGPNLVGRLLGWPQTLMTTPDTTIRSMALSGNGEILAAGGVRDDEKSRWKRGSGTVHLWNARTGKPLNSIPPVYTRDARGFTNGWDIEALALSPDARQIGVSRVSSNWKMYDIATQKSLWTFPTFIQDAAFSRDGRLIVLSDRSHISVVRASDGKVRTQWKHSGISNSDDIDLSPDGKLVASIGPYDDDDPIEIHRADNGKLVHRIRSKDTTSVRFSPDGKRLIAASSLGNYIPRENYQDFAPLRCYDLATKTVVWTTQTPNSKILDYQGAGFCDAMFSPDGRIVAAYQYMKGKVLLLDSVTGEIETTLSMGRGTGSTFFVPPALAFSPDGRRLFARGQNAILFWDLK